LSTPALSGRLGFAEIDRHLQQADALIASGSLDLSQVTQADSAGLSLLLELARRAKKRGTSLRFTGASAQVRELATFFRLDTVLTFEN
jgi:phospholipid transport system transporter-binding protein